MKQHNSFLRAHASAATIAMLCAWDGTAIAASCPDVVPNLPTGCGVTVNPGDPTSYALPGIAAPTAFCHKDISAIPQYCPGPSCAAVPPVGTWEVPGMKCGGAIPLLNPIPVPVANLLPSCPPDDWCINPATSSIFKDGALHINNGAPANTYNLTLMMGQNYMYVGNIARVYKLPAMGGCANAFAGNFGALVLSMGFSYMITPSSIEVSPGVVCWGTGEAVACDYSDPNYTAAPLPVDYTTSYQPFGAFHTPPQQHFGGNMLAVPPYPGARLPFINLPPGAQVWLSLDIPGYVTLPEGGMIITSSGGILDIPANGRITSVGDGTTVNLSPGIGYVLDSAGASSTPPNHVSGHISAGNPCYVQLIPPRNADMVVTCSAVLPTTLPPDAASHLPDPANQLPNPAIMVLANAIQVPDNTPLPPLTTVDNTCDPSTPIKGSLIEPQFCLTPQVFDAATQSCVNIVLSCPDGSTPSPVWTGAMPPPAGAGAMCPGTAGYCDPCFTEGCTPTCYPGLPAQIPSCNVADYLFCFNTQQCIWGTVGNQVAICNNPYIVPTPVPTPAPMGGE